MRTFATLKNLSTLEGKAIIIRNLNRILDLIVLDLDIETSTITFYVTTHKTLERVKRELSCIGFPILNLKILNGKNKHQYKNDYS